VAALLLVALRQEAGRRSAVGDQEKPKADR
jgi:hypothetical protein